MYQNEMMLILRWMTSLTNAVKFNDTCAHDHLHGFEIMITMAKSHYF